MRRRSRLDRFVQLGQLVAAMATVAERVLAARRHPELARKTPVPTTGRVLEVELERDRLRPAVRDV